MHIVEFDSHIENGVITIPSQYREIVASSVRVIIYPREEISSFPQNTIKMKKLYSLAVDMTGFNFNREEVNER
jgi:hypothetical protein